MASARTVKRLLLAGLVAAVALGAALALRPAPVRVELARVDRGDVRVTLEAPGKTRVREVFTVTSPVNGRLERLVLHEGDVVAAGAPVAALRPLAPAPLDPRALAEAEARLRVARAGEAEARAGAERAAVAVEQARADLARARVLWTGGAASPAALDTADHADRLAREAAHMAEAAVRRAAGEVEAARAVLAGAEARDGARVVLRAPVAGRVLRVHRESEGPLALGAPVLDLGDPADLEVVVELLSAQAVRVRPGARAEVVRWGGEGTLAARVVRLEPAAFTKVSALGVEEQRVRAVLAAEGPGWERLGDAYALDALVAVEEARGVLRVSASALVRAGQGWAAFEVVGGLARLRPLELGAMAAGEVEVRAGLAEGALVVLHPSDRVVEGARVEGE